MVDVSITGLTLPDWVFGMLNVAVRDDGGVVVVRYCRLSESPFKGMGGEFCERGRKEGTRTYGYGYIQGVGRYCIESWSGRERGQGRRCGT